MQISNSNLTKTALSALLTMSLGFSLNASADPVQLFLAVTD